MPYCFHNSHYEKFLATGEVKCIDDEIPFEIPNSWEWVRLGYIFSHCSGKALNGSDKGGIPYQYITTSNLYWNRFELSNLRTMNFKDSEIDKCTATKGDLLVCEGGDIGRAAIWDFDYDIKIQNHIHKLRLYCPLCIKFFYYIFFLYKNIGYIGGKGIGIQGLSSGALHQIILPIAPLYEQQRIVERIEVLLPYIERYDKAQLELDKLNTDIYSLLKKSILQEAIQGKLVPQDPTDEPASELLKRIQQEKQELVKQGKLKAKDITNSVIFKGDDNKYYEKCGTNITCIDDELPFEIPNNWEFVRLSDVAQIYTGNSISENEKKSRYTNVVGREYVSTKDVGFDCSVQYDNGVSIPKQYEEKFKIAPANSVLMCIEGGSAGRKIAIIDRDICFGNKLCCFSPFVDISRYIFYYLQSPTFFEMFNSGKTGIIGGVGVNNVKNLIIPIPPHQEIRRISDKIEQLLASIMSR